MCNYAKYLFYAIVQRGGNNPQSRTIKGFSGILTHNYIIFKNYFSQLQSRTPFLLCNITTKKWGAAAPKWQTDKSQRKAAEPERAKLLFFFGNGDQSGSSRRAALFKGWLLERVTIEKHTAAAAHSTRTHAKHRRDILFFAVQPEGGGVCVILYNGNTLHQYRKLLYKLSISWPT